MAKRRPTSRKATKKPARKPARKAARKAVRKSAAKRPAVRAVSPVLSLKQLRADLDLAVAGLARQVESRGPSAKLSNTQTILARWASEIDDICDSGQQEICGPTMDIPLN